MARHLLAYGSDLGVVIGENRKTDRGLELRA
jgi:hypothetical protein